MSHKSIHSFAAVILFATNLQAQQTIRGTVRDPQGKPVSGASVVLYRTGAAEPIARAQTRAGEFIIPNTAPSNYLLEVTAEGFRRRSIVINSLDPVTVQLQIAGVDQRIVVTAEGAAQTIDQVSKAASVIDAAEIAERNEYSLSETLRDTPGLLVRNLGGPGQATTIRMRGLRADATAVLIDGLRFRDTATIQADASSFLSTFNVINLDRVEILRGSGSSLYGTNAVGGTINAVSDAGGGSFHGGLQMEGGTLGLMRGRATASGGVKDNRLTFSGGLLHLNVLSGVDGDDRARSSGFQTFSRYVLSSKTSVAGRVFFSDDFVQPNVSPTSSGIPAANIPNSTIVRAIPFLPGQDNSGATYYPSRDDSDNRRSSRFWSGALIFRQNLHRTADWQTSYQRVHTNRLFMNGPAGPGFQPAVSNFSQFLGDIDTVDTKLQWRPRNWYAVTGGYEFEREGYLNADNNRLPAPATVSTRTVAGQRSNAAYFANQITLAQQRLQVSISGRGQFFALDRPQFVYSGAINPYGNVLSVSPPRALTGDLAISYFLPKTGTKLRAHGGNSYRAPGLYERYGAGFFYNSVTNAVAYSPYGDPRLSPDRYNSVDAGIDQYLLGDRVRLSGTWFYTRIAQITQFDSSANIVRPPTDPFGRSSGYFNGAGGISRGAELTAELRPARATLLRASYSYVNADTDQDVSVRGFFSTLGVPAHSVMFLGHQQFGRRTDVTVDFYRSSNYYNPLSAAGRARAYLYPGATKLDIVAGHVLWEGDGHSLRAYAKVDNALNLRYFENGFQAPRATFLTGIQILFK
ncbi:MAG: TonB-dependent receptor plug domain-containing protein [Acidobacteria bacterium]|nr:TonB-dependent receptor plug domain-containing protein [Acidobacteriota bacterium]